MKQSHTFAKTIQRFSLLSAVTLISMSGQVFAQGTLAPPINGSLPLGDQALDAIGNPEPNMKSLTQTDPGQPLPSKDANLPDLNGSAGAYMITVPGNYYLTENLVGDLPIMIMSDDVTVDLRGFEMRYAPGEGAPTPAIFVAGGVNGIPERIHVRNGFIVGDWTDGVLLPDFSSVRDINVSGVEKFAIEVGRQSTVRNCIVHGMPLDGSDGSLGHAGISAGDGAVVSHSTVREIWGDGVRVGKSSRIVDCTSNCNLGSGFVAADDTSIDGCTSFMNLLQGFLVGPGSSLANCTAAENFLSGYTLRTGTVVSNCTARLNQAEGFIAEPEVPSDFLTLIDPEQSSGVQASKNATSFLHCSATCNGSDGFLTTVNTTFTHCTADGNGTIGSEATPVSPTPGDGFDVVDSCRLVNCMASNNAIHGIRAVLDNFIEQNTCHTNGGVGIDLAGAGNTVIKNYVKFNTVGGIFVGGLVLPAAGAGGVAPIVLPSAAAPNPFGNFAF